MPTYDHFCTNEDCKYEWEEFYSITTAPPTICPKCKKETAQRGISGTCGIVIELTGQDFKQKMKEDANKISREASRNENLMANLVGENKFSSLVK